MEKESSKGSVGYQIIKTILRFFYFIVFHPKKINKHLIPKEEPIIIICNHTSKIDPCNIAISTPRMVNFLAKSELFQGWYGYLFRAAGCISVNCEGDSHSSTTQAIEYLKQGRAIGIFPEGQVNRSSNTLLLPFKNGCIKMAKEAHCRIVPACLVGRYTPFINKLKIVYSEPVDITDMSYEEANKFLHDKVENLLIENGKTKPYKK